MQEGQQDYQRSTVQKYIHAGKWHSTSTCPVSSGDGKGKGNHYGSMSRGKRFAGKNKGHTHRKRLFKGFGKTKGKQTRKSRYFADQYDLKQEFLSQQAGINDNFLFCDHRFPLLDSGDELVGVGMKYYHQPIPHRDDN